MGSLSIAMRKHMKRSLAARGAAKINGTFTCPETGKRMYLLRRHIRQGLGTSPAQYFRKWGLPADTPMISEGYRQERAKFCKENGLE